MKKIVLVALALLSTNILLAFAQDAQDSWSITIGEGWSSGKNYDPANSHRMLRGSGPTNNQTNEENPPLAPATLLLLGLGGATVGTAVCRNQKRRK